VKKILLTGIVLAVLATGFQAKALDERWPQWYVGVSGSINMLNDADISGSALNGSASFDAGYGLIGTIGYRPNSDISPLNNMRFEIEAGYRVNDLDKSGGTTSLAFAPFTAGGQIKSVSYMVNALYDVKTDTQITPYFGAGVGYSNVEYQNDSDMVFSYQFMAGVGYEPTLIPNTIWSIGYRYFGTQDASLNTGFAPYVIEYGSHNLEAGLQMRF